jgi:hypothetical protein
MLLSALAAVRSGVWRFFASTCHSQRAASLFIVKPIVIVTLEKIKKNVDMFLMQLLNFKIWAREMLIFLVPFYH